MNFINVTIYTKNGFFSVLPLIITQIPMSTYTELCLSKLSITDLPTPTRFVTPISDMYDFIRRFVEGYSVSLRSDDLQDFVHFIEQIQDYYMGTFLSLMVQTCVSEQKLDPLLYILNHPTLHQKKVMGMYRDQYVSQTLLMKVQYIFASMLSEFIANDLSCDLFNHIIELKLIDIDMFFNDNKDPSYSPYTYYQVCLVTICIQNQNLMSIFTEFCKSHEIKHSMTEDVFNAIETLLNRDLPCCE